MIGRPRGRQIEIEGAETSVQRFLESVENLNSALLSAPIRCFFHLVCGEDVIHDDLGVNIPRSPNVIKIFAQPIMDAWLAVKEGECPEGWRLQVTDSQGLILSEFDLHAGEAAISGISSMLARLEVD